MKLQDETRHRFTVALLRITFFRFICDEPNVATSVDQVSETKKNEVMIVTARIWLPVIIKQSRELGFTHTVDFISFV